MKIVKWIVIVVLVVVIGGVLLLYLNLDHIVKQTVETQGTAQLNVPATLDGVSLQLFKGTLDLSNFAIGSPQGFTSPQMLSLGGLSIDTGGILKLRDQPIHLASIRIDQPKLIVEQSNGKLNIKELMDGLASHPAASAAPPSADQSAPKEATKLIIDDFAVNGAHVIIHPGIPGVQPEYDILVPSIDMKNIGNADGAQNGAAIQDVVVALITQLTTKAAESNKLPPGVSALLSGNLDEIKAKLTTEAQSQLNNAAGKWGKKLPPSLAQPASDLLNQGFGAMKQSTTKSAQK
jgi:ribosomal protein L12E/L44/L45/RPP1/RPP2